LQLDKQPLAYALANLVQNITENTKESIIRPNEFVKQLEKKIGDSFIVFQQNDAMEFITLLFDTINTETGRPAIVIENEDLSTGIEKLENFMNIGWNKSHKIALSAFTHLVYGQNVVQMKCYQCEKNEHHSEIYLCIDIHLPENADTNTIHNLVLENYNCENTKRICDFCNYKSSSIIESNGKRSLRIWKTPKILLVHLKRFHGQGEKISSPVSLSLELDLGSISINTRHVSFKLCSIICHAGSLNYGHYFSIIYADGDWLLYDDDVIVRSLSEEQVNSMSSMFYVLVYERK
jgi:ubiquitin C-terminal hydrolase